MTAAIPTEMCMSSPDECGELAEERVNIADLSGDEDACSALALCNRHARECRSYWQAMATKERI